MSMSGRDKLLSGAKPRLTKNLPDENIVQTRPRKVMLTDLCPEEKAKVGELMVTLQNAKSQNEVLGAELKEEIAHREQSEHIIEQLKEQIDVLRIELESNVQMVAALTRELELRRQASDRLQEDIKSKHTKRSPAKLIADSCQTDHEISNRESQTINLVQCNRATQTLAFEELSRASRKNSCSVKSSMSLTPMATFPPYEGTLNDDTMRKDSARGVPHLPPLPPLSRNNEPLTYSELDEQKRQADASQLAQALLEMKKWSIEKMKRDIKRTKKKAGQITLNQSQSSEDVSNSSQLQPGNERRLLMAIHRLGKEKQANEKLEKSKKSNPSQRKHNTEIDEQALNQMLKSGDFRASRLVKSTSRTSNPPESHKKPFSVEFYDPELLDLINELN